MDCELRAHSWSPPSVFIYEPKKQRGDFYNFDSDILISNSKATKVIYHHYTIAGELLHLPYVGEIFTLLNITECINCLDQEKTRWSYDVSSNIPLFIEEYVFHKNRFSESSLFKIPETSKSEILVVEGLKDPKDEFKYAYETAGLQGLIFEEIWKD